MKIYNYYKENKFGINFIIGTIVTVVIVFWGANWLVGTTCLRQYSAYKVEYSFFSQCRIEYKGVMTPTDMVKIYTN